MRARGFTLVELIAVIAIVAILVTEVVPGFGRLAAREERVTAALSVVRAFNFARTRSIMTNRYVEVCKSADAMQCGDDATTWNDGWIVFANEDRDWDVDPGEQILLRHGPVDDSIRLTANRDGFNFRPQSLRSTTGSIFVCAGSQTTGEAVIVSYTGRIRTSNKTADGTLVDCGD